MSNDSGGLAHSPGGTGPPRDPTDWGLPLRSSGSVFGNERQRAMVGGQRRPAGHEKHENGNHCDRAKVDRPLDGDNAAQVGGGVAVDRPGLRRRAASRRARCRRPQRRPPPQRHGDEGVHQRRGEFVGVSRQKHRRRANAPATIVAAVAPRGSTNTAKPINMPTIAKPKPYCQP